MAKPPKDISAFKVKKSIRNRNNERVSALIKKIHAYDPRFDDSELVRALAWAKRQNKTTKSAVRDEEFADFILDMAEGAVDFGRADRETILAAVLCPAVHPVGSNYVDLRAVATIGADFGSRVEKLVERTLRLDMLQYLYPKDQQDISKHQRLFRLMALWTALDPRAILNRGMVFVANLRRLNNMETEGKRIDLSLQERQKLVFLADNFLAPLAYVAGYGKLWKAIRNETFRLESPADYARVKMALDATESGTVMKERELPTVKEKLINFISKECSLPPEDFIVEVDQKSPASARDTALRKGRQVNELHDRFRFRIILTGNSSGRDLDAAELAALCRKVYAKFSKEFGRGNMRLKSEFAARAKPGVAPGDDGHYNDYYREPKTSGYRAIHDLFFININGKIVEFEGQIVDAVQHETNTFGPKAGHVSYKTGHSEDEAELGEWRMVASEILQHKQPSKNRTYVFDENNDILSSIDPFTVYDFVEKRYGKDAAENIVGANIDNNDPFVQRNALTNYAASEPLRNGDRITPPQLKKGIVP